MSHTVEFPGFRKEYRLRLPRVSSKAKVQLVYTNFRDDRELVIACARELGKLIPAGTEYLVILGDKANGFATLMAVELNIPWVILTSKLTLEAVWHSMPYRSITSGMKMMYLSEEQVDKIHEKKVILVDDVLSSGDSMDTAVRLCRSHAGALVQGIACPFTEGTKRTEFMGYPMYTLGHLPLYDLEGQVIS